MIECIIRVRPDLQFDLLPDAKNLTHRQVSRSESRAGDLIPLSLPKVPATGAKSRLIEPFVHVPSRKLRITNEIWVKSEVAASQ